MKDINVQTLAAFTGSQDRVYNYDRNAEFAKVLMGLATAGAPDRCGVEHEETVQPTTTRPFLNKQRDIAGFSGESKEHNVLRIERVLNPTAQTKNHHLDLTRLTTSSTEFFPQHFTRTTPKQRIIGSSRVFDKLKNSATTGARAHSSKVTTIFGMSEENFKKLSTLSAPHR